MASTMILNAKNETVQEIENKIKNSQALVVVKFQGIPVDEVSKLRRKLRESSSDVRIYKNTLVRRAVQELGYDMDDTLVGPNAFVFGSDIIDSIKAVAAFAKENKNMQICAGIIDNKVVDASVINEYATIPSYEGLLTLFAAGLMEHVRNFAIGLDLIAKNLEEEK